MSISPIQQNCIHPFSSPTTAQKPSRFADWTWSDSLVLAGTVVAVIAFAVSWFSNLPFAAAAFAFLGVANIINAYCVGSNTKALEKVATDLGKDNDELEKIQKQKQKTIVDLKTVNTTYAEENQKLSGSADALQKSEQQLAEVQTKMAADNTEYAKQTKALSQRVDQLTAQVQTLSQLNDAMKAQNDQLAQSNAKMAQNLAQFKQGLTTLSTQTGNLNQMTASFEKVEDQDLKALGEQIAQQKSASQTLIQQLQQDKQTVDAQLKQLQTQLTQFQTTAQAYEKAEAAVAELQAQQTAKETTLKQLEDRTAASTTTYQTLVASLQDEQAKLSKIQADFTAKEKELHDAENLLQNTIIPNIAAQVKRLEQLKAEYQALERQNATGVRTQIGAHDDR